MHVILAVVARRTHISASADLVIHVHHVLGAVEDAAPSQNALEELEASDCKNEKEEEQDPDSVEEKRQGGQKRRDQNSETFKSGDGP